MFDSSIQFDAEAHSYTVDGDRYDSVTQILRELSARVYRFVDAGVMAEAAWLGQAVHKVIELDILGALDEGELDPRLLPYLEKWRAFRAHSGFVPLLSEARVFSRRYRYAGTLDLFGLLNGEAALVDAKRCASVPRTAGPQTAGYEIALRECMPDVVARAASGPGAARINRFALHLTPSETRGWTLVPFKNPNDARVFLSALTTHNWSKAA
jgi:hypothetical protein